MNENYHKQQIVDNVLQATRVKHLGFYLEGNARHIPHFREVESTIEYFLNQALEAGKRLLDEAAIEIDTSFEAD